MPALAIARRSGRALHTLWKRLQDPAHHPAQSYRPSTDLNVFARINTYSEFLDFGRFSEPVYEERHRLIRQMAAAPAPILTSGYCICCRRTAEFRTDPEAQGLPSGAMPNWREGLICPGCSLNNRMRAAIHLLQWAASPARSTRIYLSEQVTALYRWMKRMYPRAVGSEYLRDGTPRGQMNSQGVRHEDLTALSFADEAFDVILSLEVMEHIPDFRPAFAECARILASGGRMVLGVPFHRGRRHLCRALVRDDGTIEHLHPPEYHGDPLDPQGCLCFHHFGWDILDFLQQAGFRHAAAYAIWSRELGYMASEGDMLQFIAVK
jgi:SAM-dependent methyltransferase